MSSPIASFKKLSITSNMQASRGNRSSGSGGLGVGRTPPVDDSSCTDSSEEDSNSDGEDGDDLDQGTTENSTSQHALALDHCRQHGARFAFQIADAEVQRCSIRISTTDSMKPTCSCDEEGMCRHILWLLKQLARTNPDISDVGVIVPHELISSIGLGAICEKLQWELREGPDWEEEPQWTLKKDFAVSSPDHQTEALVTTRMNTVRDILATLSDSPTDDYRKDIFESSEDVTSQDAFVPHDLEATVSRLLFRDDDIFYQFKSIVSRDARASDYFRKMELKAQNACDVLDSYCEGGPTAAGGPYDLIWCAQTLSDIVDSINSNVIERQPLHSSSREQAAKALVSILRMVVKERNHDVYQNLSWPRRRVHGEPQIDRNLYQRLIGSTSKLNPAGGNFVIKALKDLPEALRFVEDLEEILGILKTIGWGAPRPYVDKLASLISQLKGESSPGTSSGKRSAGSMDGNVKRMKS